MNKHPTRVRYFVIALTTLVSMLLYVDRISLSFAERDVKKDLGLTDDQMALVLSSFFLTYALAQLPTGWLSDRYGARIMMSAYLAIWSLFTGFLGLAYSFATLVALRLGCGLFEAGAYPTAAGLIGRWIPIERRGFASGIIAVGGRFGGAAAPLLTAYLMGAFQHGRGWRPAMLVYGVLGVIVAGIFWWFFRDSPRQHPGCNDAEIALIEGKSGPIYSWSARARLDFSGLLKSYGLWLMCVVQFLTNLAWAFLITWLPRYLSEVHEVALIERGWMASLPIFIGMAGMFYGGWLTDYLVPRLGPRWGRSAPLAFSRFLAAAAFGICVFLEAPWPITIALSIVALGTDLGTPAIWAYSLDVGGKHVGSVLGWSNMFGNIGAALSPVVLNAIIVDKNYQPMFLTCAAFFVAAGVLSLFIDATKPVNRSEWADGRDK